MATNTNKIRIDFELDMRPWATGMVQLLHRLIEVQKESGLELGPLVDEVAALADLVGLDVAGERGDDDKAGRSGRDDDLIGELFGLPIDDLPVNEPDREPPPLKRYQTLITVDHHDYSDLFSALERARRSLLRAWLDRDDDGRPFGMLHLGEASIKIEEREDHVAEEDYPAARQAWFERQQR